MLSEIVNRRSIRKYREEAVKDEQILELIDAARLAPSGSNTQPWNFIIVKSPEMKERIASVDHNQQWMRTAPVFLVCVADIGCRVEESGNMELDENSPEPELKLIIRDAAVAIGYLLLEAEHMGLAACWTGWYEQKQIREILNIPGDKYVCGVITIGYGNEKPKARPRRALDDIIRYESWKA